MTPRALNRLGSFGADIPKKITDAYEVRIEERFIEHLLALPPGTRIPEAGFPPNGWPAKRTDKSGWDYICDWLATTCGITYDRDGREDDSPDGVLSSHMTVLLMVVVDHLCRFGYFEPRYPETPEQEFTRTDRAAPTGAVLRVVLDNNCKGRWK